jgi:hypothetical protein
VQEAIKKFEVVGGEEMQKEAHASGISDLFLK